MLRSECISALRCGLIACALLLIAPGSASAQNGPPASRVVVDRVLNERVEPRREVTGELRAVRESTVASKQGGRVVSIGVDAGDRVEAGAVLVRLDDTLERIEIARASARAASAEAVVRAREAGLERTQRDEQRILALGESASDKEIVDARSDVIIAAANLAAARADALAAKAELDRAKRLADEMTIAAPFPGVVTAKRTEIGEWVGAGEPVVDLVDLRILDAWLSVPEALLDPLRSSGAPAQIRVRATGAVHEGEIAGVIPKADELARLVPVRVRIVNDDATLIPGLSIVGLAPTGERRVMPTVHKDAVLVSETGSFLYFVVDGVAAAARVRVLFAVGARVVVESADLPPDADVIIEGNERLFPGSPVEIVRRIPGPAARE